MNPKFLETQINVGGYNFTCNLQQGHNISMVLVPNANNVNCYYASEPRLEVIRMGSFVGSVAEGGSVNYATLTLTPHGNGTHTECYGHISPNPDATLANCLTRFHFAGCLISVMPTSLENGDLIIREADLAAILANISLPIEALVIRTLPNTDDKKHKHYSGTNPIYFEGSCGKLLADAGIMQLILDLPSFDREEDGGLLAAHKGFWQYPDNIRTEACISELCYVPNSVPDGYYLVNIQTMNIASDASPSRIVLYPLVRQY